MFGRGIGVVATPEDSQYMELALAQAREAYAKGEVPIGAVIVAGNRVLAARHNLRETLQDPTAHAEILAIRAAAAAIGGWRLEATTMYVTLEPCPMCAGALVMARVSRLVYGAADPKAGAVYSLMDLVRDPRLNHRLQVTSGVLAEQCSGLLREFFSRLRER